MKHLSLFFTLFLAGLILSACEKNPVPADQELEVESIVKEQAAFGWEVNRLISSGQDISGLTQNSQYVEDQEIEELAGIEQLKQEALRLITDTKNYLPQVNLFTKPLADSLYIFIDDTVRGIRTRLYYNAETGLATFSEVKYKFAVWRNIYYDSVNIVVDVNYTLTNPFDDILKNLFRQQLFEPKYFVQEIKSSLIITHFTGSEITGAEATNEAWYHADRFLRYLRQYVDLNPDESGTLREDFEFRDATTSYRSVTFYPDYTGEFARQLRDGTTVTGSFNSVEDDQHGFYNETIDFPAGRYVDKIYKSAVVSITLPDSIFTVEFAEAVHFKTGQIDSSNVWIESQQAGDIKKTELRIHKANGAFGTFFIEESEEEAHLTGEWTTWNEYFITITAEYYFDGSAHIHYEVFAPPYTPGDEPILVADYYISPDGSGNGTLSYNGQIYSVLFDGSAQAEMRQGNKTTRINLFQ
jgi:hypothetical protein